MNHILCFLFHTTDSSLFWKTFGSPIATLTGVLISGLFGVWLFNKGIKKERLLEKERRELEKNDGLKRHNEILIKLKYHIITLLEGCLTTSHKQSDSYEKYTKEHRDDILGQHFPTQYSHSDLIRLLQIRTEEILELFEFCGLSNKDFINTLHHLDYLNEVFKRIPIDIHEGNGKTVIDLTNQIIAIRTRILTIGSSYLNKQIQGNTRYKESPLWIFINELIINYHKDYDGIPSVSWDYNKLIIPIKNELLKEEFRFQKICNQLIDLAKIGGDLVFSVREFNESLCSDITTANVRINESLKKLEEIKRN